MPTKSLLRVPIAVATMLVSVALAVGMCPAVVFAGALAADADGALVGQSDATRVMYRLYNPNSGEHFYTADVSERDAVAAAGWSYEGEGWTAPTASSTPVHRLYSGTDHHYCIGEGEKDALVAAGWSYEGIGWYSDDAKGVPLYRQFNPNVDPTAPVNNSGSHNYTTSLDEHNHLVSIGWNDEGIGWYGVDTNAVSTVPEAKVPNPASDFEYAVGNFIADGKVRATSFGDFKREYDVNEMSYGSQFEYGSKLGSGTRGDSEFGGTGGFIGASGYNCGYGIYITEYKGASRDVVVPDEIDGIPVVYADVTLDYEMHNEICDDPDEGEGCTYVEVIDISQCQSLRTLWGSIPKDVEFGESPALTSINILDGGRCENLDMSSVPNLQVLHFTFAFPKSWSMNCEELRSINSNGGLLNSLNLTGASKLDHLFLPGGGGGGLTSESLVLAGCTALTSFSLPNNQLTSFDVSQFPNLTYLNLSGNPIEDRTALDAWAAQPGHELVL